MPEGLSANAEKVFKAMKDSGAVSEENMETAERITNAAKLPKKFVLSALQELQQKGFVKRKVREKAAGYYLVKTE